MGSRSETRIGLGWGMGMGTEDAGLGAGISTGDWECERDWILGYGCLGELGMRTGDWD